MRFLLRLVLLIPLLLCFLIFRQLLALLMERSVDFIGHFSHFNPLSFSDNDRRIESDFSQSLDRSGHGLPFNLEHPLQKLIVIPVSLSEVSLHISLQIDLSGRT